MAELIGTSRDMLAHVERNSKSLGYATENCFSKVAELIEGKKSAVKPDKAKVQADVQVGAEKLKRTIKTLTLKRDLAVLQFKVFEEDARYIKQTIARIESSDLHLDASFPHLSPKWNEPILRKLRKRSVDSR